MTALQPPQVLCWPAALPPSCWPLSRLSPLSFYPARFKQRHRHIYHSPTVTVELTNLTQLAIMSDNLDSKSKPNICEDSYIVYTMLPSSAEEYVKKLLDGHGIKDDQISICSTSIFESQDLASVNPPRTCFAIILKDGPVVRLDLWRPRMQRKNAIMHKLDFPKHFIQQGGVVGISHEDSIAGKCTRLVGGGDVMTGFEKTTIDLRICFQGYNPATYPIRLRRQFTRKDLVTSVWKRLSDFFNGPPEQLTAASEPPLWIINDKFTLNDVLLISVVHVSPGSIMPILQFTNNELFREGFVEFAWEVAGV
ncbi:hypothetical protein EW146_g4070 [Bondarzewia mesenterica]|uniref:Uncharacterized protein n=1 Tax=Bondarzewia mesenterica TaxID=1095465 RepID=A0A4S4LXH2_9AGAM|nr:hypothetical protein EW146_g4070 [Bondarzewia mesenterica]